MQREKGLDSKSLPRALSSREGTNSDENMGPETRGVGGIRGEWSTKKNHVMQCVKMEGDKGGSQVQYDGLRQMETKGPRRAEKKKDRVKDSETG